MATVGTFGSSCLFDCSLATARPQTRGHCSALHSSVAICHGRPGVDQSSPLVPVCHGRPGVDQSSPLVPVCHVFLFQLLNSRSFFLFVSPFVASPVDWSFCSVYHIVSDMSLVSGRSTPAKSGISQCFFYSFNSRKLLQFFHLFYVSSAGCALHCIGCI